MVKKSLKWYAGGFWLPHIHLNRAYRDRLFRFLFKDKRDLLDLYNALNGSSYRDPNALEIVSVGVQGATRLKPCNFGHLIDAYWTYAE